MYEEVTGSESGQVKSALEHAFCPPMVLAMDFTLLMYFRAVYGSVKRKKDWRPRLLLTSAFASFTSLVGFSYQTESVLRHMNDISEAGLVLAFLMQISIITNDARKLSSLRSLRYFMRIAESCTVLSAADIALNVAAIRDEHVLHNGSLLTVVVQWHESAVLACIVSFRFCYLTSSRGSFSAVWKQQPLETASYALLVIRAYPFVVASYATGQVLGFFQEFYLRSLVLLCIWATTREKPDKRQRRRGNFRGRFQ